LVTSYENDSRHEIPSQEQKPHKVNDEFTPFAGCDTLEKLEKRYKSLAKTYHPDGGDIVSTKHILLS